MPEEKEEILTIDIGGGVKVPTHISKLEPPNVAKLVYDVNLATAALASRIYILETFKAQHERMCANYRAQIRELENSNGQLEAERNAARDSVDALTSQVDEILKERQDLEESLEATKKTLTVRSIENDQLKASLNSMQASVSKNAKKAKDRFERIEALEQEIIGIKQEREAREKKIKEMVTLVDRQGG